jgi:large subunit ribosomal protein L32e
MSDTNPESLETVEGIGPKTASALRAAGYRTIADLRSASRNELAVVEGMGTARADSIKRAAAPAAVEDVRGIGPKLLEALAHAGYDTVEDLRAADRSALTDVEGIGNAMAARILRDVGSPNEPPSAPESDREATQEALEDAGGWVDDRV